MQANEEALRLAGVDLDKALMVFGVAMTNESSERYALAATLVAALPALREQWERELLSEEAIEAAWKRLPGEFGISPDEVEIMLEAAIIVGRAQP